MANEQFAVVEVPQFAAHAAYIVVGAFTVQLVPLVLLVPDLFKYMVPLLASLETSPNCALKNPRKVNPLVQLGTIFAVAVYAVVQELSVYHPVASVFLYKVVTVPLLHAELAFLFNVIALQFAVHFA